MVQPRLAPERPIRVLMTAGTTGQGWHHALDLASALSTQGASLALAVMGPAPARRERVLAERSGVCLRLPRPELPPAHGRASALLRAGAWLRSLVDELQPDVVHLDSARLAGLELGVPTIVDAHRVAPGVDTERFRPLRKHPVVLAAGSSWGTHSLLPLLQALAQALGRAAPTWTVMMAELPHPPSPCPLWRSASSGAPRSGQVDQLGSLPREALAAVLGHASVFCQLQSPAPEPLILEAGACAAALVLADRPELRERWEGAALFVDPDAPGALEQAVRSLIDDPKRRGLLGAQARHRALRYPLREQARALLGLYREVAGCPLPSVAQATRAATAPAASAGWH